MVDDDGIGQRLAHHLEIAMLGGAVDDEVEILAAPGGHQIVDDSAAVVEQHRIAQLPVGERLQVAGKQRFERRVDGAAVDQHLAHVADVEQAGALPRPEMLGDDPFVLNRHPVAGELDHPGAVAAVPAVERQGLRRRRRLTLWRSGIRGTARLVVVGRAVVDVSAHDSPFATDWPNG